MAKIEIIEGYSAGESFVIGDEATLGRSLANAVCLPDGRASRHHARLFKVGDGSYRIEDLESANGTLLNDRPLQPGTPAPIGDGDKILICSTRMVFRYPEASRSPAEASPDAAQEEAPPAPASGAGSTSFGQAIGATSDDAGTCVGAEEDAGVLDEEDRTPSVNAQLDASMSMVQLREDESASDEGLQDAIRRLQAMCQVSEALGNILEQEALMQRIIDSIFDLFPVADRAFIMLRDKEGGDFTPVASRRRGGDGDGDEDPPSISRGIIKEVVGNKRSILSSDAMSDDRFSSQVSIVNLSIRSMMCAPLIVGGEILGIIQVDTERGVQSFTEEDLEVLTGISAQAAISVKNAQLYEDIETETKRRTSLQRYFSPNMVELMMSGDINTELGGKTYTGTVFMSDIIGFTPMSERMDPAELVAKLNRYFTVMQKVIYDNGGNVDKFEGDAIMAFWSVPRHVDGDERRAVLTGVEMQGKLWPFNVEMEADGQLPIHMGIGLNTGAFVAGNVGSEDKIEFTLIGDNVNLTARIESRAGRTQVLVADSTHARVRDDVAAVQLPPTMLKGKSKPIHIYCIRGVRRGSDEWALVLPCVHADGSEAGLLTAMSGSGDEMRLLLSSTRSLGQGARLGFAVTLAEYHDILPFEASVEAANELEIRPGLTYHRAVLNEIDGPALRAFLQPGACLETELTWDEMQRV